MADPPASPDGGEETGVLPDRSSTAITPRWVKVFGIIALVVALIFVVLLLTGGHHNPGRHMSGEGNGRHTLPADVPEHGAQQP